MSNGKAPPVTNLETFFEEMDAGVFAQKLATALSDVGRSTVVDGVSNAKGEVMAKFGFKRIGDSGQVMLTAKLSYKRPTAKGAISEETTSSTPFYVGARGALTLIPDTQQNLFAEKDKDRE